MSSRFVHRPASRPRLLALAVSVAVLPAAWAAETQNDTITVTATPEAPFRAGGDELVPAYLDGQVANGGRLGMLGEQDASSVPFNVVGYTAKMIEDTQANTLSDVLRNDASVQPVRSYGNFGESYRVRGFLLDGDDVSFGGLYGVLPRHPSQLYELALEGVVLFTILNLFIRKPRPMGSVSGLFLIGYGAFRIIVEFFRQPDAQLGLFGGISMGQILSVPMILAGVIMMIWAYRRRPQLQTGEQK